MKKNIVIPKTLRGKIFERVSFNFASWETNLNVALTTTFEWLDEELKLLKAVSGAPFNGCIIDVEAVRALYLVDAEPELPEDLRKRADTFTEWHGGCEEFTRLVQDAYKRGKEGK